MKIVKKNISTSILADIQKQKEQLKKKALSDGIIIGVLTFFGLIVLLLICEKFGLIIPSIYSKPVLIGLSIFIALVYYSKRLLKMKTHDISNKEVKQYSFNITDFHCEVISNTEFVIYACKTKDNKTLVFQTSQLATDNLFDTIIIEILNDKIVNLKNYSTGKTVKKHNMTMQLLNNYKEEFYLLEMDFHNL
ncbi:MAG: hypothetical protein K9I36_14025 [Bacteroidia bacterium]|nr:hypothetical protein [Bacteroidia bacterium]